MAGFGGQGIIVAGKALAQAALLTGRHVTFMPAYGAEVRGGTSNCTVIHSDEPIASPVASKLNTLIVMNQASLDRFAPRLLPEGLLLFNETMVTNLRSVASTVTRIGIPCDALALACGHPKTANMVMLGAYLASQPTIGEDCLAAALDVVLPPRHRALIPANLEALRSGIQFLRSEQMAS